MKKFLLCAFVLCLASPAKAEPYRVEVPIPSASAQCYTPEEAEAEQAIRIHSELMVIALNCQHMTPRGWTNFYQQYQQITKRHSSLLSGYETILINHYVRSGRQNGELYFHNLRTNLANKVSIDAARMRPDIFCSKFAPRLPKVDKMSANEIREWAASVPPSNLTEPLCR